LTTLVVRPGETEVQQLVLADDPRRAALDLAVLDIDVRVGVAARFPRNRRRIEDVSLVFGVAAVNLPLAVVLINTNITLIVVDGATWSVGVVVRNVGVGNC